MGYYIPMENIRTKKRGLAAIFALCPVRHILLLLSGALVLLHVCLRGNYVLMRRLADGPAAAVRRFLAQLTAEVPFSVAELLIALAVIGTMVYIICSIAAMIRRKNRKNTLKQIYIIFITLTAGVMAVYAAFCFLWGVIFYGDDFIRKSGLKNDKISTEQLETVTEYFAQLANDYAPLVPRDESGACRSDRQAILRRSDEVFRATEQRIPCLAGPDIRAKGVFFSRVMSYIDFTGFFFPITGEANVNMDFPEALFAFTVAHELSHQRGVGKEQEANFVAVMACLDYGDAEYCYSACLIAYIYLGNALYKADNAAWQQVYSTLSPEVRADLKANNEYWARFDTPVQTISNTVYEGFLQSYDQQLGLKSYGACVDLLVNYYYDAASAGKNDTFTEK